MSSIFVIIKPAYSCCFPENVHLVLCYYFCPSSFVTEPLWCLIWLDLLCDFSVYVDFFSGSALFVSIFIFKISILTVLIIIVYSWY